MSKQQDVSETLNSFFGIPLKLANEVQPDDHYKNLQYLTCTILTIGFQKYNQQTTIVSL